MVKVLEKLLGKTVLHGKTKNTGRPKKLKPRDERKVALQLKKNDRSIANARIKTGPAHVSRQTVFNYIKRFKNFVFKKRPHHPKWNLTHIDNS